MVVFFSAVLIARHGFHYSMYRMNVVLGWTSLAQIIEEKYQTQKANLPGGLLPETAAFIWRLVFEVGGLSLVWFK